MKSMEQMQNEILRKARWDGGWPRAVHMGMGIIALAKDKANYDRLQAENLWAWKTAAITAVVLMVGLGIWVAANWPDAA